MCKNLRWELGRKISEMGGDLRVRRIAGKRKIIGVMQRNQRGTRKGKNRNWGGVLDHREVRREEKVLGSAWAINKMGNKEVGGVWGGVGGWGGWFGVVWGERGGRKKGSKLSMRKKRQESPQGEKNTVEIRIRQEKAGKDALKLWVAEELKEGCRKNQLESIGVGGGKLRKGREGKRLGKGKKRSLERGETSRLSFFKHIYQKKKERGGAKGQ